MIDYDPRQWSSHFLDIKGSMVREIAARVSATVAWSAAVVAFHHFVYRIGASSLTHSLIGVALGLLLVVRTNSSYDRFWEGRKLWGSIVNESRNLARASVVILSEDPRLVERVIRWTIAYSWATKSILRNQPATLARENPRLPPAEVAEVVQRGHVPLAIAVKISRCLSEARERGLISDYVQMQLDQNVQLLVDYMGGCQRIVRTPLPFAYTVHLRRALVIYCFTLPLVLVNDYGWYTVLATFLFSYILYGIEEIGVEIEEPFSEADNDLPLDRICESIEQDLLGILAQGTVEAKAG